MSNNSDINSNFQNLAPTLLGDIAPSEAFAPSIKQGATCLMTYSDKLKDPRWQKKRLEIFQRDKFTCKKCGDKQTELQVHHLKYSGEPWEAKKEDLITLCKDCHQVIEHIKKNGVKLNNSILKTFSTSKNIIRFIINAPEYFILIQKREDLNEYSDPFFLHKGERLDSVLKFISDNP